MVELPVELMLHNAIKVKLRWHISISIMSYFQPSSFCLLKKKSLLNFSSSCKYISLIRLSFLYFSCSWKQVIKVLGHNKWLTSALHWGRIFSNRFSTWCRSMRIYCAINSPGLLFGWIVMAFDNFEISIFCPSDRLERILD